MKTPLWLAACAFVASACLAQPATERNGVLADALGMTLYTFKKDAPLQSACYDACAKTWMPFAAADRSQAGGDFAVVERNDGLAQWAYKGQPLYRYAGDATPGTSAGDGLGAVWAVVRVAAPR